MNKTNDIINENKWTESFTDYHSSPLVKVGDKVKRGKYLGTAGNTGQSSGCHEHFPIEDNDVHVDPMAVYNGTLIIKTPADKVADTGGLQVGDSVTVKPIST